jgi:hypothetical protein
MNIFVIIIHIVVDCDSDVKEVIRKQVKKKVVKISDKFFV